MKANKSVLSALLGVALLAVPITASARSHDDYRNRGPVAAYHNVPAVAARANFAPRVAANDRLFMRPTAPMVRVPARDDWRWRDRDYRPVYTGPVAAPYTPYVNNYGPGYYAVPYSTPFYGAPVLGGYGAPVAGYVANLMRQRDNAQILYHQAVANGNRDRAKHLLNDIIGLNKQIARARG